MDISSWIPSYINASSMRSPSLPEECSDTSDGQAADDIQPFAKNQPLKRKRSTLSTTSASLPLTRSNLGLLQSMTSKGLPATPSRPSGVTTKTKTTTSGRTKYDPKVDLLLTQNLIFGESKLSLQEVALLDSFVQDIVGSSRHSQASQQSVKKFQRSLNLCSTANEATFLLQILPRIIKDSRTTGNGNDHTVPEDWDDTPLSCHADQFFQPDSVPFVSVAVDPAVANMLSTPKPDRIYGTRNKSCSPGIMAIIGYHMDVCPGEYMQNPFFLIEGKGARGNYEDARIQVRRGGAAVVKAMEEIWRNIYDEEYSAPPLDQTQTRSAMFSMTISPLIAIIYVHWCRHTKSSDGTISTSYYMTRVKCFPMEAEYLIPCRMMINNILDWGIGERYTTFWNMVKEAEEKGEAESSIDGANTLSKKRKLV